MDHDYPIAPPTAALSFPEFWAWLQAHFNCILRAGTQDLALFDDEDAHWRFGAYDPDSRLVQFSRGKRVLAEMVIFTARVSYVQVSELGPEEFLYELVYDEDDVTETLYFFVLSHGFEDEAAERPRWMN